MLGLGPRCHNVLLGCIYLPCFEVLGEAITLATDAIDGQTLC